MPHQLPIGAITEIFGAISSGRTALTHSILAEATERGCRPQPQAEELKALEELYQP